jgi:hypothetical protein
VVWIWVRWQRRRWRKRQWCLGVGEILDSRTTDSNSDFGALCECQSSSIRQNRIRDRVPSCGRDLFFSVGTGTEGLWHGLLIDLNEVLGGTARGWG